MTDAPDPDTLAYVRATARLLDLPLGDEQAARVALQLHRTRAMAAALGAFTMRPDDDIAEIYRVAPFPEADA